MLATYLRFSQEEFSDFENVLNILVIKLATTVVSSEIGTSLQALDVLDDLLDKYEDKIKPESKRILKKLIFHKDLRVSKRVM